MQNAPYTIKNSINVSTKNSSLTIVTHLKQHLVVVTFISSNLWSMIGTKAKKKKKTAADW